MRHVVGLLCAAVLPALTACGDDVELVEPTSRSAFRSTYPCALLTKAMAQEILGIQSLRRVGAQSFDDGIEQCIWARGRYKAIPQVHLAISPRTRLFGRQSVAQMQRLHESRHPPPYLVPGYRALRRLGDHAYLTSVGRRSSEVFVEQDGRSFELILRLKAKPASQPPPLEALEAMARDISARYVRPPR